MHEVMATVAESMINKPPPLLPAVLSEMVHEVMATVAKSMIYKPPPSEVVAVFAVTVHDDMVATVAAPVM